MYQFFVQINFYLGMALVLSLLTRKLNSKAKYRVLSLNKAIFSYDLNELKKRSQEIQFLSFPRLLLSEIVKKYVDNFESLNDASYHPIMDGTEEQRKIYRDIKILFKYLQTFLKFDAIFAGNYVYVSQQEFFRVAKDNEVPVIVLYKEGIGAAIKTSPEISKRMYSGKKFFGDSIFFYNHAIQNMLVNANVPGIHLKNTHVVGIPRLDNYLKMGLENVEEKHITLFSFDSNVKAKRFVDDPKKVDEYIRIGEAFHFNLVKFCAIHADYSLTIKTKKDPSSKKDILRILEKYGLKELPSNIKIIATENPVELIKKSRFVAGFLSTTLLEAMLLNKYIISPYFRDLIPEGRIDFFDDYPNAVNYIKSFEDLVDKLKNDNNLNLASEDDKKLILEPVIYKMDGNASHRTLNKIVEIIETNT